MMSSSTIANSHDAVGRSILICTLGASWAVVPEAYALLAPEVVDLYRNHPQREVFRARIRELHLERPAQVWVLTTGGTSRSVEALRQCWSHLPGAAPLRLWIAERTDNLASAEECERLRELTFRLCLHATADAGPQSVVLCLAGGRKTMSADMETAASTFGCAARMHVIDTGNLPDELRNPTSDLLSRPLPKHLATALYPIFLGPSERSDLVDVSDADSPPITPQRFPIGLDRTCPGNGLDEIHWEPDEPLLVRVLEDRERRKGILFAGHIKALLEQEKHANWFGLYRLPIRQIEHLRKTRLDPRHRPWLQQLPKADLHCHLGGVLDLAAQREVGRAIWEELTAAEQENAKERVGDFLCGQPWPSHWYDRLRQLPERAAAAAALLVHLSEAELSERLFGPTEPRLALGRSHPLGFQAYELPGELSGSALLQSDTAVHEYARQAYRRLRRDGVRYCELRGSPGKYLGGEALRFLTLFHSSLLQEHRADPVCQVRFVVIADRRNANSVRSAVATAVRAHRCLHGFVVGLDIAGDEQNSIPFEQLAQILQPAFEECLPITIHAGEGQPADNIWSSVYRLHAERVGHGLTLSQRPDLAARMRDRDIAIELCPTSNLEVVGFHDPDLPASEGLAEYPLATYLRALSTPVVICTDNPGISRTTLSEEYLRAARMCRGLTLWETLALLRAGFEHAFAPAETRAELLRAADATVIELIAHSSL